MEVMGIFMFICLALVVHDAVGDEKGQQASLIESFLGAVWGQLSKRVAGGPPSSIAGFEALVEESDFNLDVKDDSLQNSDQPTNNQPITGTLYSGFLNRNSKPSNELAVPTIVDETLTISPEKNHKLYELFEKWQQERKQNGGGKRRSSDSSNPSARSKTLKRRLSLPNFGADAEPLSKDAMNTLRSPLNLPARITAAPPKELLAEHPPLTHHESSPAQTTSASASPQKGAAPRITKKRSLDSLVPSKQPTPSKFGTLKRRSLTNFGADAKPLSKEALNILKRPFDLPTKNTATPADESSTGHTPLTHHTHESAPSKSGKGMQKPSARPEARPRSATVDLGRPSTPPIGNKRRSSLSNLGAGASAKPFSKDDVKALSSLHSPSKITAPTADRSSTGSHSPSESHESPHPQTNNARIEPANPQHTQTKPVLPPPSAAPTVPASSSPISAPTAVKVLKPNLEKISTTLALSPSSTHAVHPQDEPIRGTKSASASSPKPPSSPSLAIAVTPPTSPVVPLVSTETIVKKPTLKPASKIPVSRSHGSPPRILTSKVTQRALSPVSIASMQTASTTTATTFMSGAPSQPESAGTNTKLLIDRLERTEERLKAEQKKAEQEAKKAAQLKKFRASHEDVYLPELKEEKLNEKYLH